mmetsp:Transcript_1580/g.2095  ORF Transcript_1580/g.2095 Transcript_1580/m.2095 type:complete len:171 (+) Transcript_1580:109-621(+)|eukprot:CAMPEP_0197310564 /NCGR_PEP_ID=MMETSP0891-20130614/9130_1 /TAXON_ID=44058 ORGANISM="Aureoumbra lagunensis, Strain CCMP1510" /NCGR_SAMPLE_ID=MMETSP0891 /ASSEMBLY_ACC=CAM_ASM_000534 /LENGTH=170 /DNA_ID=CAMNT_0042796257 /DNA_START=89 /DNA_END=601 /DNA_ORIENTATION=+
MSKNAAPMYVSAQVVGGPSPPAYSPAAPVAQVVGTNQPPPPAYTPQPSESMIVTCPPNIHAGQVITVAHPTNGNQMQVTVPQGVGPGGQFEVAFPPAEPVAVPTQVAVAQQVHVVQSMPVGGPMVGMAQPAANTRRCRGCGRQFEPEGNPASASAFRCKSCRGFSSIRFF